MTANKFQAQKNYKTVIYQQIVYRILNLYI